tara:strand:- start:4071 stop:4763 length:693 start_codon:yes stop_codon:yes gene_type:complete
MVSNEIPVKLSANDFDIGDLVQCNRGSTMPLYGQILGVNIENNTIEVCAADRADDVTNILRFDESAEWQPVECVQVHVPVNCDFDSDGVETQVCAMVSAWKHLGIVPLDEDTLWLHNVPSDVESSAMIPIVSEEQENIVREIWGDALSEDFSEFCCTSVGSSDTSSDDSFIDNSPEHFTRAREDGTDFVQSMHEDVAFMSFNSCHDTTERQRTVRAYLNNLHTRVAHSQF